MNLEMNTLEKAFSVLFELLAEEDGQKVENVKISNTELKAA